AGAEASNRRAKAEAGHVLGRLERGDVHRAEVLVGRGSGVRDRRRRCEDCHSRRATKVDGGIAARERGRVRGTRLFYPFLSALWMVEHHGMLVVEDNGWVHNDFESILDSHVSHCYRGRYYVHHDSLPILEPRIRDTVELDGRDQIETVVRIAGLGPEV